VKFSSAKQTSKCLAISLFAFSLLALQGCGSGKKGITIDSNPQGANVIADGKNIGVTPIHNIQDEVFPPHWYGSSYMVKGELEINKEGCEGYSMKVNDAVLMNDIKASLKCSHGMPQAIPAAAKPATEKTVKDTPAASTAEPVKPAASAKAVSTEAPMPATVNADIEQRLSKLKSLRDKGVITAEEYSVQRRRILDTL
jgi:hypothetical protein